MITWINKIHRVKLCGVLFSLFTIHCSLFTSVALTSCDSYIDITPKGAITVDSVSQYYELIVIPQRCYNVASFYMLSDDAWAKETNIFGNENRSFDGINFTFNEQAERTIIPDNNLYTNIYAYIMRQNLVIDNVEKASGDADLKTLAKAEARVLRAWDHFVAINLYAKSYTPATAAEDGGVCIMEHYDLEAVPSKSTVAKVYDFIISELEAAVPLLQEHPVNIYHPNKAYGYGLLSLVYLFHRDWEKARDAALQSLALNNALVDYNEIPASGFYSFRKYANENNPEVLSYMWMGSGWTTEAVALYAHGQISPELVGLFDTENDLRYSKFLRQSGASIVSYFDVGSGAAIWTPATDSSRFTYITVGLRTAEVYLILAEAYARLNNLAESKSYVEKLRAKRIKGGDGTIATPANQKEMMDQIIVERRKELLYGFHRFFDLKRFNTEAEYAKTIVRVFPIVNTSVPQQTYTLRPDSRLYIIPFPHSARDRNPNLTLNTDEK